MLLNGFHGMYYLVLHGMHTIQCHTIPYHIPYMALYGMILCAETCYLPNFNKLRKCGSFEKVREKKSTLLILCGMVLYDIGMILYGIGMAG